MADESPRIPSEVVVFDTAVFGVDSVKKAAYRFIDRFAVDIRLDQHKIICTISFTGVANGDKSRILDDFRKEVLDQDLRRTIAEETAPMRNTILALAFASSNLQDRE